MGIDASNLRESGGLTHLVELLRAADPSAHGIRQVMVWGGSKTLGRFTEKRMANAQVGSVAQSVIGCQNVLAKIQIDEGRRIEL